jgi:Ran GTPase-activating protein (RanGAP) involved in mRNA processing and transport
MISLIQRKREAKANWIQALIDRVTKDDPHTTVVILKGGYVGPELITALAMGLISNTHVKVLRLTSINIDSYCAHLLASVLFQNKYIEYVLLDNNGLGSNNASAIATVLYSNKSIKSFGLSDNKIGNEGMFTLSSESKIQTYVPHCN